MEENSIINYISYWLKNFIKMFTKGDKRKNYRLFLYKLLERLKIRGTISFPTKV